MLEDLIEYFAFSMNRLSDTKIVSGKRMKNNLPFATAYEGFYQGSHKQSIIWGPVSNTPSGVPH